MAAMRDAKGRFIKGTSGASTTKSLVAKHKGISVEVALSNVVRVQKTLKQFQPTLQKKLQRRATRKAGKPVLDSARSRVPVMTGKLRKNLKLRSVKRKRGSTVVGVSVKTPERHVLGYHGS